MRRKLWAGMGIGLAAGGLALLLQAAGWLAALENVTWGWRVRAGAHPGRATDRIKVILLDQPSLDWGWKVQKWSWPWPRTAYGAIVDFCTRAGAKAVACDAIFTEGSANPDEDVDLARAARAHPAFVGSLLLGTDYPDRRWPADAAWEGPDLKALPGDEVAPTAQFPIAELATNGLWLAGVIGAPDRDGVFRRVRPFQWFDGHAVPTLAFGAWLAGARAAEEPSAVARRPRELDCGGLTVPLDRGGRAILRYRGPSGAHGAYSAAAIIQSEVRLQGLDEGAPTVNPAEFKDCYVFIGASAPGLLDLRPTPVDDVYPGVEVHATALDNLLSGDFIREAPAAAAALALLALTMATAVGVTFARKAWQGGAGLAAAALLPALGGFAAYAANVWWPMAPGVLGALFAGGGALLYNYATEGRQKAFLKHAFNYYLGPEVIEQILADPSRLRLGGEKRELTIFFSDIEKFSSFSEKLDPPALTALLNEYLTEMGAILKAEGGYLDKYIGDAIVAFWGAPVAQPDHASRAVRAALRCQRRLAERRDEWQAKYGALVRMRIGLNTGEVVVGNMGSTERFNYTILGDAANLASRLEGANKVFGTYLMAAESTWSRLDGIVPGRELGRLRVVGRAAPVRVFQPLETPAPDGAAFQAALDLWYAGRFTEAADAFGRMAEADPTAAIYAARARHLASEPPAAWDGVLNLTEK